MSNNEETMIMPNGNENKGANTNAPKAEATQVKEEAKETKAADAPTANQQKSNKGKRAAAVAAAAVGGAGLGVAGAMAANHMDGEEIVAEEGNTENAADNTVENHTAENGETDYTNNAGADPVVTEPQTAAEPVAAAVSNEIPVENPAEEPVAATVSNEIPVENPVAEPAEGADEIQVLGVVDSEAAVITNGEEVAVIVDVDGNGTADLFISDENGDGYISDGEIHVIQTDVDMAQFHQTEPVVEETPDVQVVDIVQSVDENGVVQEAAILTDGETIGVVADVDGDGMADVMAVDLNQNMQFEDNEIADITGQGVDMASMEQEYLANNGFDQNVDMAYEPDLNDGI